MSTVFVTPAKAGASLRVRTAARTLHEIPAFAGMTRYAVPAGATA